MPTCADAVSDFEKRDVTDRMRWAAIAEAVITGFRWDGTPQGFAYWHRVYHTLICMAGGDLSLEIDLMEPYHRTFERAEWVKLARHGILHWISWSTAPRGADFWYNAHNNLFRLLT